MRIERPFKAATSLVSNILHILYSLFFGGTCVRCDVLIIIYARLCVYTTCMDRHTQAQAAFVSAVTMQCTYDISACGFS